MAISATHINTRFTVFSVLFILSLVIALWLEQYYLVGIPFAALVFYAGWHYLEGIFFLLLFSLPFSIEMQITSSLGTDFPDEQLMLLTTGLFLCYCIYLPRALNKQAALHPLIILLLIGFVWSIVTVIFSSHPLLSLKFLLAKIWYFGAFVLAPLVVFRDKKQIKISAQVLATGIMVVVLITMIRHYKHGFVFAGINESLQPFFRNHVSYSAMVVCAIPLFFAFYKFSSSKKTRITVLACIGVLLLALFFSYARGAWLALIVGIGAWWLIRMRMMLMAYIIAAIMVIAALFWLKTDDRYLAYAHDYRTTIFHDNFREHWRATYEFKDVSTAERFYRWIAGVRMIKDNELIGHGPSTFYSNYKPYAVPAFKTWVSANPERSTVHNYFLMITIEQGIPGLVFFLLLVGAMLFYSQKLYHRVKDPFYKMAAMITGVLLTMILTVNFLSDMIETDKVGSLFFLCLSLLVMTDINTRSKTGLNTSPDI